MADGSRGYRVALAMRQLTPEQISSSPGTAGLPPFISFSTSWEARPNEDLNKNARRASGFGHRRGPRYRPSDRSWHWRNEGHK